MAFAAENPHKGKPQERSNPVLPWQVTIDQLICVSLSHTHKVYEVSMLKVPADIYRACKGRGDPLKKISSTSKVLDIRARAPALKSCGK